MLLIPLEEEFFDKFRWDMMFYENFIIFIIFFYNKYKIELI